MLEEQIKGLIRFIDPTRENVEIEGKNPMLARWDAYYKGYDADFHYYDVIEENTYIRKLMHSTRLGSHICKDIAASFANENLRVTIPKEQEQKIVDKIFKDSAFLKRFKTFVEKYQAYGLGVTTTLPKGKYTKINDEVIERPNVDIAFINADKIVPITREDDDLVEVAIIRESTNYAIVQVHLRVNNKYVCAETRVNKVRGNYSLQIDTDNLTTFVSDEPLFQVWFPNLANNINDHVGMSRIENSIPDIQQADIQFNSLKIEFENGSKKQIISSSLHNVDANGNIRYFPTGTNTIFIPKDMNANDIYHEFNGELRVDAHLRALQTAMNLAFQNAGLGDEHYNLQGTGGRPLQTATAVLAKQSEKGRTIIGEENIATNNLKSILLAIKELYNLFAGEEVLTYDFDEIQVTYEDNLITDTESKKKQELEEVRLGLLSMAEYRSHWCGESLEDAILFVQEHALEIGKYATFVTSGLLPIDLFIDIVFGEKCKYREEIRSNIQKIFDYMNATPTSNYDDESTDDEIDNDREE